MSKVKNNFSVVNLKTSKQLESTVVSNIEDRNYAYYLIVNKWDDVCNYFNDQLPSDGITDLNVIDIFDVRNPLGVIRSAIKSHRETISTACLQSYDQLPMMVVIHKSFPRVVTYNGSIGAELGM